MYNYFDIHTHNPAISADITAVANVQAPCKAPATNRLYSYGVHPYDAAVAEQWWLDVDWQAQGMVAVGEAGLDFRFQDTAKKQIYWFEKQLDLAAMYDLPVVVHCVKAFPQTLDVLKNSNVEKFVFHGFNSSPINADRIIEQGGYVSFGVALLRNRSLQSIFRTIDKRRVFLECDDSDWDIRDVYGKAVELAGEEVGCILEENFKKVFNRYGSEK